MNRTWMTMFTGAALIGPMLGCARTTIFSRTPAAPPRSALRRVLVLPLVSDDVFGSPRALTRDDSAAAIRAHDVDATLYIVSGAAGADSGWTLPTTGQVCAMSVPTTGCTFIPVVIGGSPYRRSRSSWRRNGARLRDGAIGGI